MNTTLIENNRVSLIGQIETQPEFHHKVYGETFYKIIIRTHRLSETDDLFPVIVSEKILTGKQGDYIKVEGQIRTYNDVKENKRKLLVYVFALDMEVADEIEARTCTRESNTVFLKGYLCKAPNYRTTPFGREISDLLVAANRSYHKSDYVPCIAWGRNAKYTKSFKVGQLVELTGRFQSRKYNKKKEDGTVQELTAYEISILNITAINE